MQNEILDVYPDVNVQVYAIWFGMLATDQKSRWDGRLLHDPRATHWWDEERVVGTWFAEQAGFPIDSVEWDKFYLYEPETEWTEDGLQPSHISSGFTVFGKRELLMSSIVLLLEG